VGTVSDHHAHRAFELLAQLPHTPHQLDGLELGSAATAHALLAVEARLGELVEQQRLGNTIAAFQSRAVRSDADYVLATVRGLLGMSTEESENR
jgi:hypothetical protein